jgi:hypothetical protein
MLYLSYFLFQFLSGVLLGNLNTDKKILNTDKKN